MVQRSNVAVALLLATASAAIAFTTPTGSISRQTIVSLAAQKDGKLISEEVPAINPNRRTFLTKVAGSALIVSGNAIPALAEDGEATSDAFESIAARAARVSEEVKQAEIAREAADDAAVQRRRDLAQKLKDDKRSIYDFSLPVGGHAREVAEILGQTFGEGPGGDGWTEGEGA
eukprot:CAMPEP_0181092996 /NCGR_PEP_ID=MMETSP1071-20121207/9211_1 /TAXON_ID=35127 /ORGANISM="Thalassiosira sp., Strain NH16" /LENGTH=173 /DNA_ID=CAMNT_0023175203 /DNA_START=40 /DNA_END=558 /DNA_ORIENTATION=-